MPTVQSNDLNSEDRRARAPVVRRASEQFRRSALGATGFCGTLLAAQAPPLGAESVQVQAQVVETLGQDARADAGWTIAREPHLRIGLADGPEAYLFNVVESAIQLPAGEILVTDRSGELRYFDKNGTFLYRGGRQGQGPGEFTWPAILPSSGDSLWVWDSRQRRLTAMSLDGRTEHWRGSVPPAAQRVEGIVGGQVVSTQRLYSSYVNIPTIQSGDPMPNLDGIGTEPADVEISLVGRGTIGTASPSMRRVARFPDVPGLFFWFTGPNSGVRSGAGVPFRTQPTVAVGNDVFYVTRGEEAEILEYGPVGVVPRRVFRVNEAPRTLTRAEFEEAVDRRFSDGPEYVRDAYKAQPLAPSIPTFQSLLVDQLGWVWARVYEFDPSGPVPWMVFGLDGRAVGIVETPEGLTVRNIGEDFVLGTRRGEFGVEYVERYALTRR